MLRVLQRTGWRWVELGGCWNELGGGGWSWVELSARFIILIEKRFIQNLKKSQFWPKILIAAELYTQVVFRVKIECFFGLCPKIWLGISCHMLHILLKMLLICGIFAFPGYLMTILVSWNLNPLLCENKLFLYNLALFYWQKWAATFGFCNLPVLHMFWHRKYEFRDFRLRVSDLSPLRGRTVCSEIKGTLMQIWKFHYMFGSI